MSDLTNVASFLTKYGIEYENLMCRPEAYRFKKYGPHIYAIKVDDLVWEFLPHGCLERFTTTPNSRYPEENI